MALFKILRGDSSRLSFVALNDGFAYFTPDNGRFYIDVALDEAPLNIPIFKQGQVNGKTVYRLELRPSVADTAVLANAATYDTAPIHDPETGLPRPIIDTYIADLSFNYATSTLTMTRPGGRNTSIQIPPLVQVKT